MIDKLVMLMECPYRNQIYEGYRLKLLKSVSFFIDSITLNPPFELLIENNTLFLNAKTLGICVSVIRIAMGEVNIFSTPSILDILHTVSILLIDIKYYLVKILVAVDILDLTKIDARFPFLLTKMGIDFKLIKFLETVIKYAPMLMEQIFDLFNLCSAYVVHKYQKPYNTQRLTTIIYNQIRFVEYHTKIAGLAPLFTEKCHCICCIKCKIRHNYEKQLEFRSIAKEQVNKLARLYKQIQENWFSYPIHYKNYMEKCLKTSNKNYEKINRRCNRLLKQYLAPDFAKIYGHNYIFHLYNLDLKYLIANDKIVIVK